MKETFLIRFDLVVICVLVVGNVLVAGSTCKQHSGLRLNFYNETCPRAEEIVRDMTWSLVRSFPVIGPRLLKQHFVDCFVRGCDASILLTQFFNNEVPERGDPANRFGLAYVEVEQMKEQLEQECPGVVSCADIIALSARDAVSFQFQKPMWPVYTGRRDGFFSRLSEVPCNRPHPYSNFTTLKFFFESKGLDVKDLVALSGAHTFGVAHCQFYDARLYNFTGKGDQDPSLDPAYAEFLKMGCPPLATRPAFVAPVPLDPLSPNDFDSRYYEALLRHRGLLETDAALLTDPEAARIVKRLQDPRRFLKQFAKSMVKMGGIDVLTGDEGEVRKTTCIFTNAQAEAIRAAAPKPSATADVIAAAGPTPGPIFFDIYPVQFPPSPDFSETPVPAPEPVVVINQEPAPPPMPSRCPGF